MIEICLDSRLSLKENLKYLNDLVDLDLNNAVIYDQNKKIFLDGDVPLERFEIDYFITLHLFS